MLFGNKALCKQCHLEINLHVNNVILKKITTQTMSFRNKLLRKYRHFFIIQISCCVKTSYLWHLKNNRHVNIEISVVLNFFFFFFNLLLFQTSVAQGRKPPVGYLLHFDVQGVALRTVISMLQSGHVFRFRELKILTRMRKCFGLVCVYIRGHQSYRAGSHTVC